MGAVFDDVRSGLRVFARSPGFAAVTVITLALGIGANTAVFSIISALVLRELPVRQPERLVQLSGIYRNGSKVPFSFPMFQEMERGQAVFSDLFGWSGTAAFGVEVEGTPSLADVRAVTGNYYSALGAAPALGRLIGPEDVEGGTDARVAVLGYEFWERRFGRDPAVIGKPVRVEGAQFTIVGVTRKWFTGMTPGHPPEITVPLTAGPLFSRERSRLWIFATGRLRDDVTIERARAQLQSFWPALVAATVPTQSAGRRRESFLAMGLDVQPAATGISVDLRARFTRALYLLMGLVGLILLIGCVNLANLTLARAAARGHEFSVRAALGAGRWRIARQLLTESAVLSGAGALLALGLGYAGSGLLVALITEGSVTPVILNLGPDWRVLAFTTLVAVATTVLVGLAPARQLSIAFPASALRRNGRTLGRGAGTLGKALIVSQIALSLVLLFGAGLLLRSFQNLRSFDPGFHRSSVLEVSLYPASREYADVDLGSYLRQLTERVRSVPGVQSVALSSLEIPAGASGGWRDTVSLTPEDRSANNSALGTLVAVSPEFFKTLGIPLVRGRDFGWTDDERHSAVAIVDADLAERLGPSDGVLGQYVRFGVQPEFQRLEIIGVARGARLLDVRGASPLVVYVPCLQHRAFSEQGNLLVRANKAGALARTVAEEIRSLGREYAAGAKTLAQTSDQALVEERATALLAGLFGAVALLLAGTGLFGLISYTTGRRTREIGIRLALGSPRDDIVRMIVRETLALTAVGIIIGVPCALAATRLIAHVLFGTSPYDPLNLAAASVALIAAGAIAGYLPARKAVNVDPMTALKYE